MGDIVKYAENKIRAFLGVKSRLSVYSLDTSLQQALDSYFEDALAREVPKPAKKEEKHDYDSLYDSPNLPLSLENAKSIEEASWSTTNELISAFEEEIPVEAENLKPIENTVEEIQDTQGEDNDLKSALGKYLEFVIAVKDNNSQRVSEISREFDKMPEAIVDEINELAVETIGDVLIEEGEDGFEIIDCYSDMI